MKKICVIGCGYVGLVTGTCFADLGNQVVILDIDEKKIATLKAGGIPIYEPGLEEMVQRNVAGGRLSFTTSYQEGIQETEFVFVAVGTPEGVDGEADMEQVRMSAESIAEVMDHPITIVNKSTVPVGSGDWVADIVREKQQDPVPFAVVANPEFLREGSAINDFLNPDRIVLGSLDQEAMERVAQLYLPLRKTIMTTDLRTAEMIKYASNAFLATRLSFINEIAKICEKMGADVKEVAAGMGYDKRIGHAFLDAGLGYGGSCFPKDVKALERTAVQHGCHPQLLRTVMEINQDQRHHIVRVLQKLLHQGLRGTTVGLLGLAFKPNTDDMRDAPSLDVARMLINQGAAVRGFDPVAMANAARLLPQLQMAEDPYDLAQNLDALVVVTEWNEFKQLDLKKIHTLMRQPVMVDGRNIYDPPTMRDLGFRYRGIGRGYESHNNQ